MKTYLSKFSATVSNTVALASGIGDPIYIEFEEKKYIYKGMEKYLTCFPVKIFVCKINCIKLFYVILRVGLLCAVLSAPFNNTNQ